MKTNHPTILPIPILSDNYVWTIIATELNAAVVVDPGDAQPVSDFLKQQQLSLVGILVTHHHWDHTNGVSALQQQYKAPVFGPATSLREQDTVVITGFPLSFQVLAIPGHTRDHVAFYTPGILFCGDTLFAGGCGRLFEGTAKQLYDSLQKMAALPDDTSVYCAHEYTLQNLRFAEMVEPDNQAIKQRMKRVNELRKQSLPSLPSLLSEEKQTNPFLRCDIPEVIASVEKYAGRALNTPLEVFTWVRKWKDKFK